MIFLINVNPKYKFIETVGCTAFNFTVNDKVLSEVSEQERNEILEYLFLQIKKEIEEHTVSIEDVVRLFQCSDYEHDPEPCSSCYDTISTMTWNI